MMCINDVKDIIFKKGYLVVFLASILAVLIYTNIIPPFSSPIHSGLLLQDAFLIDGRLASNPQKISARYYKADFCLSSFCLKMNQNIATTTAKGKLQVFLPCDIVEQHYPGALYTSGNKNKMPGSLYETGALLQLEGKISKNDTGYSFFAEQAKYKGFGAGLENDFAFFRGKSRLFFKRLLYRWKDSGGLLLALLCGSKEYIKTQLQDNFRLAGLSFVLALSGMHLALFSGLALSVAQKVVAKRFSYIFQGLAVGLFVWFAGLCPSLTRSVLCLFLFFIGRSFLKNENMLPVLATSFLLHCFFFPQDARTLSFVLSYSALLGIFLFSILIQNKLCAIMPMFLAAPLSVAISAQICTAPICAVVFGFLNPLAPIASLVVCPLVSLFMIVGLLSVVLCLFFPSFTFVLGEMLSFLYFGIDFFVKVFACVPLIYF